LSSKTETSWKIALDDTHDISFFFCYYYCGNFYFLSNNPGMSFITKDQFTVGIVLFFGRIYIAFVYFQRNDMDTDAIYTMVSLVVIIIISLLLNYFLVIKIFCFDSNSREWYGFAIVQHLVA
jgi:hypothetical protein